MNFNEKTGEDITEKMLSQLKEINIPLDDCRAQGYDGGSNMSGKVKGVKSRILEMNKVAFFTPCAAHSLNRVGVNAAKICHQVVTFIGNLESLYVFFSHSPARWEVLQEEMPLSLKRLSETRWSERVEAVRPVAKHYPGLLTALDRVLQHMSETLKHSVFNTVIGLKKYFSSFEGLVMTIFWHKVLSSIEEKSVIVQSKAITLDIEMALINDLQGYIQLLRDSSDKIFQEARLIAEVLNIASSFPAKRVPSSKSSKPNQLTPEETFRNEVVFVVLDFLLQDLQERFTTGSYFCDLFSPILRFSDLNKEVLSEKASVLVETYDSDLSTSFVDEIFHLKTFSQQCFSSSPALQSVHLNC